MNISFYIDYKDFFFFWFKYILNDKILEIN